MTDAALEQLAGQAGIGRSWTDVFGQTHRVPPPTLRHTLASLGYKADTASDIADSLRRITARDDAVPPLVTAERGYPVQLPAGPARYQLRLEDGRLFDGFSEPTALGSVIPAILEAGYHDLVIGGRSTVVAVAPQTCFDLPPGPLWGLAVQLYALRGTGDAGLGDFAALAECAAAAARRGANAIAISPVHAQFSADVNRFSPYSPSSRTALNVLHAPIGVPPAQTAEAARLAELPLVDWPRAGAFRLAQLRAMQASSLADPAFAAELEAFRQGRGAALMSHAVFEALHAHFLAGDPSLWHWRRWPVEFQNPHSNAVAAFARDHAAEIAFHLFAQFAADRGLAQAQAAARRAGMSIGLIADLAVGTDSGGSQCWSHQSQTLLGLTVGAPPDLLQRAGQNWGLAAFSPSGLRREGYQVYLDMLRAAMAHAGGLRIDHAMGLNRLWVIPDGADGSQGAYLSFPEQDLMRLIKLESQRNRAVVLAEDLGTVPEGFSDRLRDAGLRGLRVLWFERDAAQDFKPPAHWTRRAAAMTSTHDLPTVAGWWRSRDLDWRARLGQLPDPDSEHAERNRDRASLWQAFQRTGAAQGDMPPPEDGDAAADAACIHVGRSACDIVMVPAEDALALPESPNLPGTLDEHPNWRRRLPGLASTLFDDPRVAARLAALDRARRQA